MRFFIKSWMLGGAALVSLSAWAQDDYQLGMGYQLSESITLGGYFSVEYGAGEDLQRLVLEDVAVLAYGNLSPRFSFLAELESVNFYVADFENGLRESNPKPSIERLYGDYKFSDNLAVRFGKQITPIGYWNLQPINVLRETTSSPRFSTEMFPKFLSGLDFYGFAPFDENLNYHVYLQGTEDLDDEYINIYLDSHYGVSLEKSFRNNWKFGGSIGRFTTPAEVKTRYVQLNTRYDLGPLTFLAEAIRNLEEIPFGSQSTSKSAYAQLEYRYQPKHALIGRIEYFSNTRTQEQEHIGIIGYSFRPLFPVSLKVEYQWHSQSHDNQLLTSFSVLF